MAKLNAKQLFAQILEAFPGSMPMMPEWIVASCKRPDSNTGVKAEANAVLVNCPKPTAPINRQTTVFIVGEDNLTRLIAAAFTAMIHENPERAAQLAAEMPDYVKAGGAIGNMQKNDTSGTDVTSSDLN